MNKVFDLSNGEMTWGVFWESMEQHGFSTLLRENWPTELLRVPDHYELVVRDGSCSGDQVVIRDHRVVLQSDWFARIQITGGTAYAAVVAKDLQRAEVGIAALRELVTETPGFEAGWRPVTFWAWGPYGSQSNVRRIAVPSWAEIEDNYSELVAQQLESLMSFQPEGGGQLLLWRGEPGTGKTFALRSLINEWREWADFHYIVDPDKLFGQEASYLTNVLFHEASSHPGEEIEKPAERWKVLILEDCGEMLSKDARERSGQGLSRLLNVVDGLIGQGLKVLVLVTTNEELGVLHDAIRRPGRCVSNIGFHRLSYPDSKQWLESHGYEEEVSGNLTLAEMYAKINQQEEAPEPLIGFAS